MIDSAHPYGLEHVRKPHSGSEVRISAAASNGSDSMYHRIHLVLRRDASLEILTSRFRKRVSGHALSIRSYYQPKEKKQYTASTGISRHQRRSSHEPKDYR